MSRWPSHLRSCGVYGRRRDRVRARVRLARARRMVGFQNRALVSMRNTSDVQILPSRRVVAHPVYFTIITPGRVSLKVTLALGAI